MSLSWQNKYVGLNIIAILSTTKLCYEGGSNSGGVNEKKKKTESQKRAIKYLIK